MKTQERHIEESAKDTTAFVVVKNLLLTMACSWVMQEINPVTIHGTPLWVLIAPIFFICYLGYRVSVNRSYEARAEAYNAELAFTEAEEQLKEAVKNREEAETLMKEIESKADAFEKMQNDLQTLGKERQTLTEQVQALGKQLANAKQVVSDAKQSHADAIETLKQTHKKSTASLLAEKVMLNQETISLRNELEKIKLTERQKYVKKAFSASKSANKGDLEKVKSSMEVRAREENEPLFLDFDKYL